MYYERVIVIGADGFIGRNICAVLDGNTYIKKLDIQDVDITDQASLDSVRSELADFIGGTPFALVNAAGLMNAPQSRKDPETFYRVNGTAAGHVMKLVRALGDGALVHISSETVFGQGDETFGEDGPRWPRHPYGISKLVGEILLETMEDSNDSIIIFRLPIVVGPGQVLGNPISMFCEEAQDKGTITLFNGGTHRRKFVHVGDVAMQVAAMMESIIKPGIHHYNCSGFDASMNEIAEKIRKKLEGTKIVFQQSELQAFSLTSSHDKVLKEFSKIEARDIDAMIEEFLNRS